MIPEKLKHFLITLNEKTDEGIYKWNFDGKMTSLNTTDFSISIWYNFDHERELGFFGINYYFQGTPYAFYEYETEQDYDFIRTIFDSVKISNLKFPF